MHTHCLTSAPHPAQSSSPRGERWLPDTRRQSKPTQSACVTAVPAQVTRSWCFPALPVRSQPKGKARRIGHPYETHCPNSPAANSAAGAKLVEKRSHRRAPSCSRARCVGDSVVTSADKCSTKPVRLVDIGGRSPAPGLAKVRRSRPLPSNDVHLRATRGSEVVWRNTATEDPLPGAIVGVLCLLSGGR
jgi:hypothetical protein